MLKKFLPALAALVLSVTQVNAAVIFIPIYEPPPTVAPIRETLTDLLTDSEDETLLRLGLTGMMENDPPPAQVQIQNSTEAK